MKITYNWLKEFVKFNYTPQQLAEHLTMLGLEVELVVPAKLFFSGVVVGKILEIEPHPNAQKLVICKVNIGKETLQIVCGAKNISTGDLVPAAVIDAILSDNTRITKRNILGIDSFGMLCSEKELGLSDGAGGIFILSNETTHGKILKIGAPLEAAIGLNDTVLDINVTPNRSDALSVIGIAREISCLTGNPIKYPKIYFPEKETYTKELADVRVKATKLCPRYTARIIKGVKIKQSPFWIRYRLGLLGIRPVNNVVDITNLILLELGQPLHAFDYSTIIDHRVIIRTANPGEVIVTIDNEQRTLDKDILVIADDKKPIAIAGVMGGKETEIGEKTTDILLESAYFNPANIRRTSKRFNLITESSYRFERAIDPEICLIASNRTTELILKIAGGNASKGIIDQKKDIPKPPLIKTNTSYFNRILGVDIPIQKINLILKGLGCKTKTSGDTIVVKPPSWRSDITKKIDLTEEVARLFGYTKIHPRMPEAMVEAPNINKMDILIKKLYALLTGMGLNEIITYSFINPNDIYTLRTPEQQHLKLLNPVDQNISVMRTTLTPGIVNTIIYNISRGNDLIKIFEIGKCFLPLKEENHLGIGILGTPEVPHWRGKEFKIDFYYLKGIMEELLKRLFIYNYQFLKIENHAFHPARACEINLEGKKLGIFGEVHPQIVKELDIKDTQRCIYIAELNIESLLEVIPEHAKYKSLPKFPAIRRDISIILDKKQESYDIIKLVREIESDLIESVDVFDLYEGHPVPDGKKSVAYAVIYRHKERTLTDEEVDNIHKAVRQKILENVPCEIRE